MRAWSEEEDTELKELCHKHRTKGGKKVSCWTTRRKCGTTTGEPSDDATFVRYSQSTAQGLGPIA